MPHVGFIATTTSWTPGTQAWLLSCLYWVIYSDACPVHLRYRLHGFDKFPLSQHFLEEFSFGWPLFAYFAGDGIMLFIVNTAQDGATGRGSWRLRKLRRSSLSPSCMTCQCYCTLLWLLRCSRHMALCVHLLFKSQNFNTNADFQPSISKLLASTKELKSKETVSRRYADVCFLYLRVAWPAINFLDGRLGSSYVRSYPIFFPWLWLTIASISSHLDRVPYFRIFGPFSVTNK